MHQKTLKSATTEPGIKTEETENTLIERIVSDKTKKLRHSLSVMGHIGEPQQKFTLKKKIQIIITTNTHEKEEVIGGPGGSYGISNNHGMLITEGGSNNLDTVKAHLNQMQLFAQRHGSLNIMFTGKD